jgi:hypothetical protein
MEQEFIMLIMNCKKYITKALIQKKTWLKNIPSYLKYYHVIGDEELDKDYKFDENNNILWVKTPDDYVSLPKKVIRSYKAINDTFKYKYIFKTDDDQMLVKPIFFDIITKVINSKKPQTHYGGFNVIIKQKHLSTYYKFHPELPKNLIILPTTYCSGRFYFLSKEAIEYLISKEELIKKEYLEDYCIGFHLDEKYKTNIINIKTNAYFVDIEKILL